MLGLPLGAIGGLALSMAAASLPVDALAVNAIVFGLGTGVLGATAVALAEQAGDGPALEPGQPLETLPG